MRIIGIIKEGDVYLAEISAREIWTITGAGYDGKIKSLRRSAGGQHGHGSSSQNERFTARRGQGEPMPQITKKTMEFVGEAYAILKDDPSERSVHTEFAGHEHRYHARLQLFKRHVFCGEWALYDGGSYIASFAPEIMDMWCPKWRTEHMAKTA